MLQNARSLNKSKLVDISAGALAVVVLYFVAIPIGAVVKDQPPIRLAVAGGTLVLLLILSFIAASILARVIATSHVDDEVKTLVDSHRNELTTLSNELSAKHIAGLRHEVQDLKALVQTMHQMVQLYKKPWLVDDSAVQRIEADASSDVMVMAPDLYYELQRDYQVVIAANIIEDPGPLYRYIIPATGSNRNQAKTVQSGLTRCVAEELQSCNDTRSAADLVSDRFKVKLLDADLFPVSVLYGLALYRWKDGKEQLLQYLPRQFGALNIEIPQEDGKIATNLYQSLQDYFDRLFA